MNWFINNSGQGNCMYYAYGISLMYYLRGHDEELAQQVFDRLELDEDGKKSLLSLLAEKRPNKDLFTIKERKTVIEPVLNKACRATAAKAIFEEFIDKPDASELISVASYQIRTKLKNLFTNEIDDINTLLDLSKEIVAGDYTKADLLRTEYGIKPKIDAYVQQNQDEFKEVLQKELLQSDKKKALDALITDKAINFFTDNEHANLSDYLEKTIKSPNSWGSDKTLAILHCWINKGIELKENTPISQDGAPDDNLIKLQIKNRTFETVPDIELENVNNNHWVSWIPNRLLNGYEKLLAGKQYARQISQISNRAARTAYSITITSGIVAAVAASLTVAAVFFLAAPVLFVAAAVTAISALIFVAAGLSSLFLRFVSPGQKQAPLNTEKQITEIQTRLNEHDAKIRGYREELRAINAFISDPEVAASVQIAEKNAVKRKPSEQKADKQEPSEQKADKQEQSEQKADEQEQSGKKADEQEQSGKKAGGRGKTGKIRGRLGFFKTKLKAETQHKLPKETNANNQEVRPN